MRILEAIERLFGLSEDAVLRVGSTLAVLVVWVLVLRFARRLVGRTVDDARSRFEMSRGASYVIGILCIAVLTRIWLRGVTGVVTYLGLLSAGVAIALQDLLTNLAGWLFILLRRPFRVGQRIQIGAHTGDVVDIRPFRFVMLEIGNWVHADQSTGRVLHIPNGWIFKNAIANFEEGFGFIWNELEVTVTFESDWRKAKRALETIVADVAGEVEEQVRKEIDASAESLHVQFLKLTPVVWTSVADSGVKLTMRYLCKPRERRRTASDIWERMLTAFDQLPEVDLAYPTIRRFDNVKEGKVQTPAKEAAAKEPGRSDP